MPQTPPPLVGSKEACRLLDINRSTITRWVASGRLVPFAKVPGTTGGFLFALSDVEALATARTTR